jgi:hypothetical protein
MHSVTKIFRILSGFVGIVFTCHVPVSAQNTTDDAPLQVQAGEIRLEGTLRTVDFENKNFTLEATSFILPGGRSGRITTPKPKTVLLRDKVLLFVRGTADKPLETKLLQAGQSVIAVGKDDGSGKPLTARAIAVWDSIQDGRYRLAAQEAALPKANEPEKTTPGRVVAVTAPAEPVVRENPPPALAVRNETPGGDFENLVGGEKPEGWVFPASENVQLIEDETGNHYVRIGSNGRQEERRVAYKVLLAPEWKTLKVTARMRVQGLIPGENNWETARVSVVYHNAQDAEYHWTSPISLIADTQWNTFSGVSNIPERAKYAMVYAGTQGKAGEMGVDNIVVEPDGPLDAPPLRDGFPEGNFEDIDNNGIVRVWNIANSRERGVVEENGNHFLRLTNPKPGQTVGFDRFWKLDPEARIIRVSTRLRGTNLVPGKEPYETGRLGWVLTDAQGNMVGGWQPTPELRQDSDWRTFEYTVAVPKGAVLIKLTPMLLNCAGTVDIDDIDIKQFKPRRVP